MFPAACATVEPPTDVIAIAAPAASAPMLRPPLFAIKVRPVVASTLIWPAVGIVPVRVALFVPPSLRLVYAAVPDTTAPEPERADPLRVVVFVELSDTAPVADRLVPVPMAADVFASDSAKTVAAPRARPPAEAWPEMAVN